MNDYFNLTNFDLTKYDCDITIKGIDFVDTEVFIREFLSKSPTEAKPKWESRRHGIHTIPAMGYWNFTSYAEFVIDYNQQRLLLRIGKPTFGITIGDSIEQRNNFGDYFLDYLIRNNFDLK